MSYFSMHNHSEYSNITLIDSINKVDDLIQHAAEIGLKGMALTDHEALSGHMKAIKKYKKVRKDFPDFKIALGNEIYITKENLSSETHEHGERFFHCILIAKDKIGHKQLRELSNRAWDRAYMRAVMRRPTYMSDILDIVGDNPGHLIATTACLGGMPGREFLDFGEIQAFGDGYNTRQYLNIMNQLMEGDFYIELQPSNQADQIRYNKAMVEEFWNDYKFVYATDSHYLKAEDREIHKAFLNSKDGDREVDDFYSSAYMMKEKEVWNYMKSYLDKAKFNQMTQNSLDALSRVKNYSLNNSTIIPSVDMDMSWADRFLKHQVEGFETKPYINKYLTSTVDADRYYIAKILEGLKTLVPEYDESYVDRLETEMEHVWETSVKIEQPMSAYFNTMARMIEIIWSKGDSLVGVSRGSAASYLSNYCLGITQLDPMRSLVPLPYWRFMHKDRPDFPDIDIDTEGNKRLQVINAVREYFQEIGGDLIQVATFGTEGSRGSLKTAARGLGIPDATVGYIGSLIPNERGSDWSLTDCMFGNEKEGRSPLPAFQTEVNKLPMLWEVASKIEGMVTRVGIHAAGVVAINRELTEFGSMMRTTKGVAISSYDLHDCEDAGMIKYDFLTINALDKIRVAMNFLLEDDVIDWQGSLKDTYYHYLEPAKLDYEDPIMWQKVQDGEIMSLFQFDTPVGGQAIKKLKPENFIELAAANSLMRLQATEDGVLPLDKYDLYKNNIKKWYNDIRQYQLTDAEIEVLEEILLQFNGVADTQELVMEMVMHPKIGNGDIILANKLRKGLAKKVPQIIADAKKLFFDSGTENGTSINMLSYIWNEQIQLSLGYSFSIVHVAGYTTIAMQEMNLATKYPSIYWNTANLCSDAGAFNEFDFPKLMSRGIIKHIDDEDKRKTNKIQYGKIASAVSDMRDSGVDVKLPGINKAKYGFIPDKETNSIVFGLQAVSKIGEDLIDDIIKHRPFESVEDFVEKMTTFDGKKLISKDRVVNLIKAGAFDDVELDKSREELLMNFVKSTADLKKTLNLRNVSMLLKAGFLPKDTLKESLRFFNFTEYLRKQEQTNTETYFIDEVAQDFLEEEGFDHNVHNERMPRTIWDAIYDRKRAPIKQYIIDEQDSLLEKLNTQIFEEAWSKYGSGNRLSWELDALNFYHSGHELENIAEELPIEISDINDIEEGQLAGYFMIKGQSIPELKLHHIVGTVLDKDKTKHIVYFSTPNGVVGVKLFRTVFAKYDKKLTEIVDGKTTTVDDSWFAKGTKLLITGVMRGDYFSPKVYKKTRLLPVIKLHQEDGTWMFTHDKPHQEEL